MERGIFVTGVCQRNGIAVGLSQIMQMAFPHVTVTTDAVPSFASTDEEDEYLARLAQSADVVLTTEHAPFVKRDDLARFGLRLLRYPVIRFNAFHPDMVYVAKRSTNALLSHYHSALIIWGYVNGIDPDDIAAQFTHEVYAEAGYYDVWDAAVASLDVQFKACGFSVRDFILPAKRPGIFMYSYQDHPTPSALAVLAKPITGNEAQQPKAVDGRLFVNDFLLGASWPAYPEIARSYLAEGRYLWLIEDRT